MKRVTCIFCIVFFSKCLESRARTAVPTHLFIQRLGPCLGRPSTTISVSEMSISRIRYNFSIDAIINISRDIPNGWRINALMQKCQDIRNLDTCDFFRTFDIIRNGCSDDEDLRERDIYILILHYAKLACPLMAGSYKLFKYQFSTEDQYFMVSEAKISTSEFGYTLRLEGYSEDEQVFCAEAYLKLIYLQNPEEDNHHDDDEDNDKEEEDTTDGRTESEEE